MQNLIDIIKRSVEDYGFRQVAQWSPGDLVDEWGLSSKEAEILTGPLKEELDRLPVPVEPQDYGREEERLTELVKRALA